ncbi:MAG: sulfite exporter TauE/SafE family protein [candidate division Zixibacteria bacterium]|nr:sulfite exporter TauE/SafE family protein [candidate division Zixibacteria bacterium]
MFEFPTSGVETYWWLPALVAFVISFFTSMGGISGAFLLMPFQVSILGFSSPGVSATNLVYNVFAIPGGVYRFIREKRMVWPLVITIIIGTTPGLIVGAYIRMTYLADPSRFKLFVGLVLLYMVTRLIGDIINGRKTGLPKTGNSGNFEVQILTFNPRLIEYDFNGKTYRVSTVLLFMLSLIVGVIGGAYGIGGGAIISPFLVAILGLPVYTIAGAALFGTFFTSIAGIFVYTIVMPILIPGLQSADPDWLLGLSLGIGGFAGIYLGARVQRYLSSKIIKIILAISITIVVIKYVGGYFF